jgi:asparagine synthase (glutamine-hydrolysing)
MCGIAGIFNLDGEPVSAGILKRMTDAIAHRGPDGEGFYTDGPIGLGHRRLKVIDLSPAGHQPMISNHRRSAISYNGEVYNFRELRLELESLGYRFQSQTDTEVVLYAYEEWGVEAFNRFNGMFAVAIWDRHRQRLVLARDRYGIKPLYYTIADSTLLFGSEVKAILQSPDYRPKMDQEGLVEYLTFQNFFTDRTLFAGVRLLPAGSYLEIGQGVEWGRITRYWDFDFTEQEQVGDAEEYAVELRRLMEQAVSRQLVSDVPVGTYLSGGLDSGSIAALSARQLPDICSFTVGFDLSSVSGMELAFDERDRAEEMSYLFKTEHYAMVLKGGDMERVMPKVVRHIEEPRVGQCYPNYYAAKLASKFVTVVLSGAGGDELFGGYPWRYYRAVVNDNAEDYVDKYYKYWQRLIPNRELEQVLKPIWNSVGHVWTRDIFRDVLAHRLDSKRLARPEEYVNQSLYFEAKTFLHGLLVVEDKLSMAHGLETRVPFLDNDLVDFAMKVPVGLKLGNLQEVVRLNENEPGIKTQKYFERTRDGKLLLRQAASHWIPEGVTQREKQGFSAPDASWFKGDSVEYVKRHLFRSDARIYQYLDRETIGKMVEQHLNGEQNRRLLIWSLLYLEQWCREFL